MTDITAPLEHVVYISTARPDLTDDDVFEIVETSRYRNRAENVTGLLLFNRRNFMQVLEGPHAGVEPIYAAILRDARHSGVIELARGPVARRNFHDWSMGFSAVRGEPGEPARVRIDRATETLARILPETVDAPLREQLLNFQALGVEAAASEPRGDAEPRPN